MGSGRAKTRTGFQIRAGLAPNSDAYSLHGGGCLDLGALTLPFSGVDADLDLAGCLRTGCDNPGGALSSFPLLTMIFQTGSPTLSGILRLEGLIIWVILRVDFGKCLGSRAEGVSRVHRWAGEV